MIYYICQKWGIDMLTSYLSSIDDIKFILDRLIRSRRHFYYIKKRYGSSIANYWISITNVYIKFYRKLLLLKLSKES